MRVSEITLFFGRYKSPGKSGRLAYLLIDRAPE